MHLVVPEGRVDGTGTGHSSGQAGHVVESIDEFRSVVMNGDRGQESENKHEENCKVLVIGRTLTPDFRGSVLDDLVDLIGFEPMTSSMPWKRAPNCATGPL